MEYVEGRDVFFFRVIISFHTLQKSSINLDFQLVYLRYSTKTFSLVM